MNKDLKSILVSLSVILLYLYATTGIAKLFWKDKDRYTFNVRVDFISIILFISTLFMFIVPYHLFGSQNIKGLYYFIMLFHLIYLIVGAIANSTIKHPHE